MAAEIKVEKDIEEVRALIKEIDTVQGEVNKIQSSWNAYEKSIPSKNVGDDEIAVLFTKLLSKDYRSENTVTNVNTILETEPLKKGIFSSTTPTAGITEYIDAGKIATFKTTLISLCKKLVELKDKITDDSYRKLFNILNTTQQDETTITTSIDTLLTQTTDPSAEQNKKTVTEFINKAKTLYESSQSDDQYTNTERNNIAAYFKENTFEAFFKPIKDNQALIATKVNAVYSKLIDISTKYSGLDTRIKKDVFEKLKPKDITSSTDVDEIINNVTQIVAKFTEDHKIHSTIRAVTATGGSRKKKKVGGAKVDREDIKKLFTDVKSLIVNLKTIASELYKGLGRFSNPEIGDASKGEDSIFNKLFEKYLASKDNVKEKGDFIASTELINNLKSNDIYPETVLKIDMRDKFVFVATTLFMRIISLIIIEIIIDRKIITRMDTAIFWYGVAMTLFIIVFVLVVNFDSYKLRIIFNYVNFHIGYSTTFSYITQLWLFGGLIYYIMIKINNDVISSATNDEERARLKHKVQVVSMITWFFLTLGVLVM